jgi:uncharacterized membrane protein
VSTDRGAEVVDFLWLLLPLGVLAAFEKGSEPAGLAVGFAVYVVGPLLGGLIMLEKGRSVRAGLLVAALLPILGHVALLGLAGRR